TMSVWRLVGRPSKKKGYLPGMVLVNGEMRAGYGGGLCQLSNLIYWMTLHTELTVTERFRHQYDVFPDSNRTLPFGSGATIAYNYIDLQIRNDTKRDYYLRLDLTPTHLLGEWRCMAHELFQYEIIEKNHHITQHSSGKYLRHNQIWRKKFNDEGVCVREECVAVNHAIMMYSPLLQSHNEEQSSLR
ncbi:MAG: VanW family protein, partial [Bacilli bacterium]